jgi:hypothetical protein
MLTNRHFIKRNVASVSFVGIANVKITYKIRKGLFFLVQLVLLYFSTFWYICINKRYTFLWPCLMHCGGSGKRPHHISVYSYCSCDCFCIKITILHSIKNGIPLKGWFLDTSCVCVTLNNHYNFFWYRRASFVVGCLKCCIIRFHLKINFIFWMTRMLLNNYPIKFLFISSLN